MEAKFTPGPQRPIVLAVHPNGHVERITTRKQYEWAKAEGLKPFLLGSRAALAKATGSDHA